MGSLEPAAKVFVVASLGAGLVAAIVIVALGAGWSPPGGSLTIGADAGTVPRAVTLLTLVLLAIAAGSLAAGSSFPGWRWRWVTLGIVGLVGAALAGGTIAAADVVDGFFPGAHQLVPRAAGWLGLLCVAGSFVAAVLRPERPLTLACLAAAPMALSAVAYVAVGDVSTAAQPGVLAGDVVASAIVTVALDLGIAVGLLLVWTTIQAVNQMRDLSLAARRLIRPSAIAILVALAVKVGWLALGYAAVSNVWALGSAASWAESRADGPLAWALAVVLVGTGATWLLRGRVPPTGFEPPDRPLLAVVVTFTAPLLLAAVATLALEVSFLLPTNAPARALARALDSLLDPRWWLWVVVLGIAGVAALAVGARRERSGSWPFLAVLAAWCVPRAVVVAWLLIADAEPPFRSVSLATLDTVISVAALGLAVAWLADRQRRVPPEALFLVVFVSTLLAHPGLAVPTGWTSGIWFFLALVYAPAYRFLLDAGTLNVRDAERSARVLRVTAIAALLLGVAMFRVGTGQVGPGVESILQSFLTSTARLYLAVPVAVIVMASVLRRMDPTSTALPISGATSDATADPTSDEGVLQRS